MDRFQKTQWVDNQQPAISASQLNRIENGIYDNQEAIIQLSEDIDDSVVFQVERTGTGADEIVDLNPITDGRIWINCPAINDNLFLDYGQTTSKSNRQILNGQLLLSALAKYIPGYNAEETQILRHSGGGGISWFTID